MKYMTMKEAFECGDDDIPFVEDGFNDISRTTKKGILEDPQNSVMYPGHALSEFWQVQKAELEVLTVDKIHAEWHDNESLNTHSFSSGSNQRARLAINKAFKNGMHEEWNRMKGLRDTINNAYKEKVLPGHPVSMVSCESLRVLLDEFNNLKPPYEL